MWEEVYYRDSRRKEEKILPYMVLIREKALRSHLKRVLTGEGFRCVAWNDQYPGVLVNTELKRFGMIHRPCRFSCVGDRDYTYEEFLTEVFWKDPTKGKRVRLAWERQAAKALRVCSKIAGRIDDFGNRKKYRQIREDRQRLDEALGKVRTREEFVGVIKAETLRKYGVLTPGRVDRAIAEYDGLRKEYESFLKTGTVNTDGLLWCIRMMA